MWPKRKDTADRLSASLKDFSDNQRDLPGIATDAAREALAMQMVASIRRLDYSNIIRNRNIHPDRANPKSPLFDPERAAVLHERSGDFDEAVWLVFLATHFGKHRVWKWRCLQDVYSGLPGNTWNWERVNRDPAAFRDWLRVNRYNIGGKFGSHRPYESLDPDSSKGTAAVIESYVNWIGPSRSHADRLGNLVRVGGNDPHSIFDIIYENMRVLRFGRLGKFDFLALLGRMDLVPISPGSAYLAGATGPLRGALLLYAGSTTAKLNVATLEEWLQELDAELRVGMQVMEDSLCNWQKKPTTFVHFRG
jgi:hypothetical protein